MSNKTAAIKPRLIVMNFLQFAIWGSYLISMGTFLSSVGMSGDIGLFYAVQGVVSLFMPALIGIIADRWIPAQKCLGLCQIIAAAFMLAAGIYAISTPMVDAPSFLVAHGVTSVHHVLFAPFFTLYTLSVAFYMPTIALSNSVAYASLEKSGLDTITHFPPIRIFGTIGFICAMLAIDWLGFQASANQFFVCAGLGLILGLYSFTLPQCPTNHSNSKKSVAESLGLNAFLLFKQKKMAIFFIFSMFLGVSLQITNGFANLFLESFKGIKEYSETFAAQHANTLISISQISETLCILLIPFVLKHFGIKRVMLIAMFAWVLRFALLGVGNPGGGVWMFILSMIVYGFAFDFFNISGSLFVDRETSKDIRSSAQGLFMIMTNGVGATIGTLCAQGVVDHYVFSHVGNPEAQMSGWSTSWLIFAGYALVVAILFWIVFKDNDKASNHQIKVAEGKSSEYKY